MHISRFFIDRPIFSGVISILIIILGAVAFLRLPIAQYPEIAPPIINVSGQYPGASADVVASTVVAPIEQQINGVENMLYVSSNSSGDGRFSIQVTFDLGTNLDTAQVQIQNRVGIAAPRLAFAGVNPHAGESGTIGREEIDILEPAIAQLRAEGIDATGPFAADTLFHARARKHYDAALCCYHDQALVPIKTLHFDEGVNMTLGLPIVRTSPDHGTAFNLAGSDRAHPGAMIAAIAMAGQAADRRARA